jgi:hypothetical protein
MPLNSPITTYEFIHVSKAWYAASVLTNRDFRDEVHIAAYDAEKALVGEFAFRWYQLSRKDGIRLEAFNDSWRALAGCPELLTELTRLNNLQVSPERFCEILTSMGFVNMTPINNAAKRA